MNEIIYLSIEMEPIDGFSLSYSSLYNNEDTGFEIQVEKFRISTQFNM